MGNQNIRLNNNVIHPSDIVIDEIIKHTNNNIEIKASPQVIEKLKIYGINGNENKYFFIMLTQYPHIAFSWPEPGYDNINDLIIGKHNAKYIVRITGPKSVPNMSFFFFRSIVLVQYIIDGDFNEGIAFSPQWNTICID
jgi:hypothetical protein